MAYTDVLEQSIPGFNGLTSSASAIINDLLNGGGSYSPSQNRAAQFGVTSGMPGSGVSNAFGYDLHNKRGEERKQRGIDDLLKLVTGYSGTVAPTAGQQIQDNQFQQTFNQQQQDSRNAAVLAQRNLNQQQRPRWGTVTSGWDAQNNRPSSFPWGR